MVIRTRVSGRDLARAEMQCPEWVLGKACRTREHKQKQESVVSGKPGEASQEGAGWRGSGAAQQDRRAWDLYGAVTSKWPVGPESRRTF